MKNHGVPQLTEFENCLLEAAINRLDKDVRRGEEFVGVRDPEPCDPCDPKPKVAECPQDWCKKKARK